MKHTKYLQKRCCVVNVVFNIYARGYAAAAPSLPPAVPELGLTLAHPPDTAEPPLPGKLAIGYIPQNMLN